eukprot:CAMPEP_0170209062 /NCGR_PEP_ID=MMETSP0116_2-20130129/4118_1 /TAXON_ID=400756 /ORGANISM="Durinskia baltica, Strain CSIRO CS-38" /LENGTH=36 /DNA_ID= /DNA_START= /DNA_END= /DNA_ORIENTATION=
MALRLTSAVSPGPPAGASAGLGATTAGAASAAAAPL